MAAVYNFNELVTVEGDRKITKAQWYHELLEYWDECIKNGTIKL